MTFWLAHHLAFLFALAVVTFCAYLCWKVLR